MVINLTNTFCTAFGQQLLSYYVCRGGLWPLALTRLGDVTRYAAKGSACISHFAFSQQRNASLSMC